MSKGKTAAKTAQLAAMNAWGMNHVKNGLESISEEASILALHAVEAVEWFEKWITEDMTTIVLRGNAKQHILNLFETTANAGIPTNVIHDLGRTQISPTEAVGVAIGPAPDELIDELVGDLKLL